jgi:hypothetical protein
VLSPAACPSRLPIYQTSAAKVVVSRSEHRVVIRSRLRDRLDDIPVLDHLPVLQPVDVNDGFAARTVRQAVPVAVENDVIPTVLALFVSDMVVPFRVDLTDIPRITSDFVVKSAAFLQFRQG